MSNREVSFWYWIVNHLMPKKLIYFTVMQVWARATTEKYTDKHPNEVTWEMAVKFLGIE